jgi:WD40 repeat protein
VSTRCTHEVRVAMGKWKKILFFFSSPDPFIFSGHGGNVKRSLFCNNDKYVISCAEDKTVRLWDRSSGQVKFLNLKIYFCNIGERCMGCWKLIFQICVNFADKKNINFLKISKTFEDLF